MRYRSLVLVLLGAGVLLRLLRYFLSFPIWGDEAFVCLNVLDRSPAELTGPLRFDQVAPVLFLWIEWAALQLLGPSELALRLPALIAGLASLVLFARLTCLVLSRPAAILALGLFAVSYYPIRHSCEVKPYAFDLLMSLVLLTPAAAWLRSPARLTPLVGLLVLVPIALAASYPAVFTAGAVSLALLPTVRRESKTTPWLLYLGYNLLLLASFAVLFLFVGQQQHASMVGASSGYWDATFPPWRPVELVRWLFDAHTGNMLAYPIGGRSGGSLLTLLACLLGALVLRRTSRGSVLVLLLAPFLLNFIAAALGKYPYGGSARVAQHLAPSICLLAGLGLATLLRRVFSLTMRRVCVLASVALLMLFGLGGAARDIRKPFKTHGDDQARELIRELERRPGRIFVLAAPPRLYPSLEWYLRLLGERVVWVDDLGHLPAPYAEGFWCLRFLTNADAQPEPPKTVRTRETFLLELGEEADATRCCEVWQFGGE